MERLFRLLEQHNALWLPFCVFVKYNMLCNCLCSSSSRFSASRVWDCGIVNQYSWLWKSLNMADQGSEFSFFQGIHVRTNIRIDISIPIRPMTTTFGKQVHLGELTQMTLISDVITSWSRHKIKIHLQNQSTCNHQNCQDGNLP